jgi:hypothetical protein
MDPKLADQLGEKRKPTSEEQLALYCLEMFSTGLRVHTYGGLIDKGMMSIHYIDRDGRIAAEPFNVFKNWGLFTAMLVGLSSFDAEEWGFLPNLKWDEKRCLIPVVNAAPELNLPPPALLLRCEQGVPDNLKLERYDVVTPVEEGLHIGDRAQLFPPNLSDTDCTEPGWARVTLKELIYVQYALLGRGTALFRVHQDDREGRRDLIVKISSQAIHRSPERLYLRHARKGLTAANSPYVRNLPVLVGWAQSNQLSDGPRGSLHGPERIEKDSVSDRMVHVLVLPFYTHIYRLKTEDRFKRGMRDCFNCRSYRAS